MSTIILSAFILHNELNIDFWTKFHSLRSKAEEFKLNTVNADADLYLITENNLFDGICDSGLFDLVKYSVFRRDRETTSCSDNKKLGRGVMIRVWRHFSVVQRVDFQSEAEDIWVTVFNEDSKRRVQICCVYLPPRNHTAIMCSTNKL